MAISIAGTDHRFELPDIITMEALYRLKQALVLPRMASHRFERYFAGKVGDTITVKRPYQAKVTIGSTVDPAAMIDKSVEIKLDKQANFALEYNDLDQTIHINDFSERYLRTGAEEIAYYFDEAGAEELANGLFLYNAPSNAPGNSLTTKALQEVRAHASEMAIPQADSNFLLLNPMDFVEISEEVKDYNNPPMVEGAVRQRYKGFAGSWKLFESTRLPNVSVPPLSVNLLVAGAGQGGSEINVDAASATTRLALRKGNLIQIANVFETQPRGNRKRTGRLATFVVTEDLMLSSGATRTGTLKIYPEIIPPSGSTLTNPSGGTAIDQSAFQTVSNLPADNAIITRIGGDDAEEKTYRQGLAFDRSALEYVNVELHEFISATLKGSTTDPETGLSMRLLGGTDVRNAKELQRLDVLFGVKTVYPEVGVRLILNEV